METALIIAGAIITLGGAFAAIKTWIVKPLFEMNCKLDKIDKLEKGQKMLMKAQAQTMEHIISGNNVEALREEYDNLRDFIIDN